MCNGNMCNLHKSCYTSEEKNSTLQATLGFKKLSFQFLRLLESHYDIMPFITDVASQQNCCLDYISCRSIVQLTCSIT